MFPVLSSKAILAPMSGVTNVAFRHLCKSLGAGLTVTEFASSAAIVRKNQKTFDMIKVADNESPCAVQLFGNDHEELLEAAKIVAKDFDIIDINCGCPAYKVIRTKSGSELLKEPDKIRDIVRLLTENISKPVTVKIRTGIDDKHINAVEVAKKVEEAGASAITVHGRTQKQGYSGKADWSVIKAVKDAVSIPVIGNGDVWSADDAKRMLDTTGCDYVMVGRAARNDPFIFKRINHLLEGEALSDPTLREKLDLLDEYFRLIGYYSIERLDLYKLSAQAFTRGYDNMSKFRDDLRTCKNIEEVKTAIQSLK